MNAIIYQNTVQVSLSLSLLRMAALALFGGSVTRRYRRQRDL